MNVFKQFQTFIIGIIFWKTDAAVTVETGNSVASFVCGNSENIICTITPFGGTMTWQIGVIPAASCSSAGCSTNSMFSADYTFKFNETAGVFDLIINNVTLSVNNTEFSCDDGLTSDVIKASVTVTDDFQTFDNESSFDSSTNQTELKVTTGCLTDDTASKVKFIWYYLKVNDSGSGVRVRNDSAENEAKTENDSKCLADPDCGSSGFRQVSSVLTLTEVDDGDFYTFEVVIDYGTNVETSVSFYDQFKLKFPESETESGITLSCYCGLIVAYLMIWIFSGQLGIYGHAQCSYLLKYKQMKLFVLQYICTHFPCFGLIPAVYIHYTLDKSKVKLLLKKRIFVLLPIVCIPILGLLPMFLLAWNKRKTDRLHWWIFAPGCCLSVLVLETIIALLCPVWHKSQWHCLIIAFIVLMFRWITLTCLALYYKDKGVPTLDVLVIAMCCTPFVGGAFYICLQPLYKRLQITGSNVAERHQNLGSYSSKVENTTENNKPSTQSVLPGITGVHTKLKGTGGSVGGREKLPPIKERDKKDKH